ECNYISFFQAEDVIRYFHVTGVQTCALPILAEQDRHRVPRVRRERPLHGDPGEHTVAPPPGGGGEQRGGRRGEARLQPPGDVPRSEERRVGKECKTWMYGIHKKIIKNKKIIK